MRGSTQFLIVCIASSISLSGIYQMQLTVELSVAPGILWQGPYFGITKGLSAGLLSRAPYTTARLGSFK
ncbi:hypothetical protein Fmac_001336 [Flemingia macrophylla]|uniref:Uncharacterized protein n=1 Tax=Flemingia macrophylla TaxID=520843 RepID=A0ABD1NGT8_9FABA